LQPILLNQARDPLRRLDVRRMVSEPPPRVPYVVETIAVEGALGMLSGPPGAGKSLLSGVFAIGVALGRSSVGIGCKRGRALIVDAENGEYEIHRRVHTLGMPADGVEVYEAEGFDLRRDLERLAEILASRAPTIDLLVLDSYRSLWGGEENDSGEVAAALDPLRNLIREFRVAALLLHHTPKSGNGYRGSSAIAASVDLGFTLGRDEDDPDPTRRYLECWKCRVATEPPKRWLSLAPDGDRVLVSEAEPYVGGIGRPDSRKQDVANLIARSVLPTLVGNPLTTAEIARAVDRSAGDGTVRRALADLENVGWLPKTSPHRPCVTSSRPCGRLLAGPNREGLCTSTRARACGFPSAARHATESPRPPRLRG
jgi:AAA domain